MALGAFTSLSMAPLNFWPAIIIGLSALFTYIQNTKTPLQAGITGMLFSFSYFCFSLSWVGNALLVEDNPYWWAWPFAVTGLPFILSLFSLIFFALYKKVTKNASNSIKFITFALTLFLIDLARSTLFTGFPWNLYGYTWIRTPFAQIVSLGNIHLLNGLTILWALTPAYVICKNKSTRSRLLIATSSLTLLTAGFSYGYLQNQTPAQALPIDFSYTIVQPNIKQSEKWKPENRVKNFKTLLDLSRTETNDTPPQTQNKKAHYIVWPETSISQDLLSTPWVIDEISKTLKEYPINAYLITGALRHDGTHYYNSTITINRDGKIIETYNKSHLVPFGEYMPFDKIIPIAPIVGFTGFKKGNYKIEKVQKHELEYAPYICYEIIFPQLISQNKLIINVTNDAWYGDSAGPRQHLVQTQFRAIENATPIIRAANTGISAIIDSKGNIIKKIALNQKGIILE